MRKLRLPSLLLAVAATPLTFAQTWTGETIGLTSAGGTFVVNQGKVQLTFGANAVVAPTTVQLGPSPLAPESPSLLTDTVVAIGRPSQVFSSAVQYWVKYDPLALPAGTSEINLRLYRLSNHRWVLVGGTVDTVNRIVKGSITAAGTYAVCVSTVTTAPAENQIIFRMFDSAHNNWFKVDAFSAPVRANSFNPALTRGFALVSPTYNSIVYPRRQPSGSFEVMASNADGSNSWRLTNIAAQEFYDACYTPDGKSVFFVFSQTPGTSVVARVNLDGTSYVPLATFSQAPVNIALNPQNNALAISLGNSIRIVNPLVGTLIRTLTWSNGVTTGPLNYNPAGTVLSFSGDGGPGRGAYTVVASATGGTPAFRLSADPVTAPYWSPDGTKIAAVTRTASNHFQLMTATASGALSQDSLYELEDVGNSIFGFCIWR